jgi:hypothetical protein
MDKVKGAYTPKLNVVFHGLWAYEIRDNGIYAHTSKQQDHVVRAGKWVPEFDLKENMRYELKGIKKDSKPIRFDDTTNAIFKGKKLSDPAGIYCTVMLPPPLENFSLRPISFATTPYLGRSAGLINSKKIAIVQVFTYEVDGAVELTESDGNATQRNLSFDLPQPITNLYFYAQPPGVVQPGHFEEAFGKLAGLFGLDLIPVVSMPPGPLNPGVSGLNWLDLVGLNERAERDSILAPAGGLSGSSCDPFVVDNRSLSPTKRKMSSPARPLSDH